MKITPEIIKEIEVKTGTTHIDFNELIVKLLG